MKKLLVIILIWMGVFVLLRPVGEFKAEAVGNIVYRRNLVTGIITADNGDKSYAVEIGESGKSIKKIFTLSPDPDLVVGNKARIFYRGGNKEDMILLAPTKPAITIIRRYALIVAYPDTFQLFDKDGILLKSIYCTGWSYAEAGITMDSQGNIYTKEWDLIKKYDSNLNLLITHNIESASNIVEGINIGADGYLYSLECIASGYDIKKRSLSDLTIVETIPITTDPFNTHSGGICLDSNGNFYCIGDNDDIVKYNSAGALLASKDVGSISGEYAGCGVLGDYVYFVKDNNEVIYLPLDLSSYSIWNLSSNIAYSLAVADGHIILSGWDADGDGATAKYGSDRNLVWVKKLDPITSYAYKAGGYNF